MFNREKALAHALRVALAEKRLLQMQVMALRDPDAFKWVFVKVNDMFHRLARPPYMEGVYERGE